MDKNTILAFVLIGLILIFWPVYQRKVIGIKPPVQDTSNTSIIQESDIEEESDNTLSIPSLPESIVEQSKQIVPVEYHEKVDTVVLETDLFIGKLSSVGGGTIISWKLKKHLNHDNNLVELIPEGARGNLGISLKRFGEKEELVGDVVFHLDLDEIWIENGNTHHMIRFTRNFKNGGRIEKEFITVHNRYDVDVQTRFINFQRSEIGEEYEILWNSGLSPTEGNIKDELYYAQAAALQGGELLKTKGSSTGIREGLTNWVVIRNKYFLATLIPRDILSTATLLESEKIKVEDNNGILNNWKEFKFRLIMSLKGLTEENHHFTFYIGPMDYHILKSYNVGLEKMMNFGMAIIRPFSIAFFYTLQFLNSKIHNYGWAIIIFSILIKIFLYPLTRKSYQSMRRMQELQPKIMALKDKFKNDPQKMNQETMKLYKQHGVNPMGGCLPMLLQMPVLFALFNLFRTTIMLRQASFLGISDLSAPDKLIAMGSGVNLLPILMGISMIIQQKLAMKDPKQKAMTYIMPLFLMFIFYRMSAGLNLYYLMFNLLTIVQEMIIKKHK
jgi:YidC/Oxa1 family membrane protein insertase